MDSVATIARIGRLSRLLTAIEDGGVPDGEQGEVLRAPVREHVLGVTGPPGAGKSTIVDRLIGCYRDAGREVGVLAVDPSSPFTGGAFLGDRVRMMAHAEDPSVFIRSMGSRGLTNGLAPAIFDACRALSSFGYGIVVLETVGVGQVELGIADIADIRLLVLTPNSGDWVQASKAGILEVADIVAVNKADLPGARDLVRELREARPRTGPRRTDVLAVVATDDDSVAELYDTIERRVQHMREAGTFQQRRRDTLRSEITARARELFETHVMRSLGADGTLAELADMALRGELAPSEAADAALASAVGRAASAPTAADVAGQQGPRTGGLA